MTESAHAYAAYNIIDYDPGCPGSILISLFDR